MLQRIDELKKRLEYRLYSNYRELIKRPAYGKYITCKYQEKWYNYCNARLNQKHLPQQNQKCPPQAHQFELRRRSNALCTAIVRSWNLPTCTCIPTTILTPLHRSPQPNLRQAVWSPHLLHQCQQIQTHITRVGFGAVVGCCWRMGEGSSTALEPLSLDRTANLLWHAQVL